MHLLDNSMVAALLGVELCTTTILKMLTDFDEVPDNSNKRPTYSVSSDSMQEKTRLQF